MALNKPAFAYKVLVASLSVALTAPVLLAQWIGYPAKNIPRLPDGKPDLKAPAPKQPDGKPDLSGVWTPAPGYIGDITRDMKQGELPIQPWAADLYKQRRDTLSKDDPTGWCVPGGVPRSTVVPYPFKILHAPGMVVILYEAVHHFRQIFLDGREIPKDPNPTWLGYSVGKWEGDTLVVETRGFGDNNWLDNFGHPGTEQLRVTERFRRRDFGHIDAEFIIDDPKAYTKPWSVKVLLTAAPDDELMEYVCAENNKDLEHLVGK